MQKLLGLLLVSCLIGCTSTEKETEEVVRNSLKDPESAQFQNVDGVCGEVNARNGYGGYTGFKEFYVSNGTVVFRDTDDETNSFEHGIISFCQTKSKLSELEKQKCAHLADVAYATAGAKNSGTDKMKLLQIFNSEDNAKEYKALLSDVYEKKTKLDPTRYALERLYDCLDR